MYDDEWSEKWGLKKLERIDVEQADIAVLMSTLIGAALPVNSEGVIPIGYLHYNKLCFLMLTTAEQWTTGGQTEQCHTPWRKGV